MLSVKISKFQQQIIWEKIISDWLECRIADHNNINNLYNLKSNILNLHCWDLAKLALEASIILKTCNIPINIIKDYLGSQEVNIFLEWMSSYHLTCKNLNYEEQSSNALVKNICFIINNNFNNKTINLNNINNSSNIHDLNINNFNNNQFKIECLDFIDELNKASRWVLNPEIHGNIGIVVIDLENIYLQVDYIFSNYLNYLECDLEFNEYDKYNNNNNKLKYNIKYNTKDNKCKYNQEQNYIYNLVIDNSLYNNPAIKAMLLILKIAKCYLNNQNIKYEDFSKLLRTKFIAGYKQELNARSYVDYILRKEVDYKFNWEYIKTSIIDKSKSLEQNSINIFVKLCNNFEKVFIKYNLKKLIGLSEDANANQNQADETYTLQSCEFWIEFIKEILQAFSWSSVDFNENYENHQNYENYQYNQYDQHNQLVLNYLRIVFDEYLSLQEVFGLHSFEYCYSSLVKILQEPDINDRFLQDTINIKKSKIINKHIKILSLSKAISSQVQFDYLWVCGLNEYNYFYKNQFNPFLPIKLQKEYARNFWYIEDPIEFNRRCLNYLQNNTKEQFICSYSLYIDNNPVKPSVIIDELPNGCDIIFSNNRLQDLRSMQINQILKFQSENIIEKYYDDNTSTYLSNEFHGTGFLKSQIDCPFQANAKFRLQAHKLEIPSPYLTKAFQGEILHKTLANFWIKHQDLAQVKLLSKLQISKDVSDLAFKSLLNLHKLKNKSFNTMFLHLEAKRIADLCYNFIINYDVIRSDFRVLAVEKKSIVNLKEFSITIKIDRIDELKTQELLIIDYKTGKILSNPFNLDHYRNLDVDDPQLFIYSLYNSNNIQSSNLKSILLANIRSDKIEFLGFMDSQIKIFEDDAIKTKLLAIDDWQNYFDKIYAKLYVLIKEFKQGIASVKPKNAHTTCRICELQRFCRILTRSNSK